MKALWVGLACFVTGLAVVPLTAYIYLLVGAPPAAVTDPAFPAEKQIVHVPLHARIDREMPAAAPLQPTTDNLAAGASVYRQQCAFCHGSPDRVAPVAKHMYPVAPQLWQVHRPGVVGVSDDPVGETYWKVKNGIRLAGMPAYADLLTEDQMWQVSLLVKNADKSRSTALSALLTP